MSPVPLFAAPVSSASLEAGRLSAPAPARLSAAARLCAPARSAAGLAAPKGQEAGRGRKPPLRPRLIGRFRPVAPAVERVRTPCELKGAHPLEWMVSPVGQVHGLEEILRVHTPGRDGPTCRARPWLKDKDANPLDWMVPPVGPVHG